MQYLRSVVIINGKHAETSRFTDLASEEPLYKLQFGPDRIMRTLHLETNAAKIDPTEDPGILPGFLCLNHRHQT